MARDWALGMMQAIGDVLTAYLTVQARLGLWPAYSEYLLYDPIVRVARYRGWAVECEVPLPKPVGIRGDSKRLDFRLRRGRTTKKSLLLEVKSRPSSRGRVDIVRDVEKLRDQLRREARGSRAFVLIAGREQRTGKTETAGFDTVPKLESEVLPDNIQGCTHDIRGVGVRSNKGWLSASSPSGWSASRRPVPIPVCASQSGPSRRVEGPLP